MATQFKSLRDPKLSRDQLVEDHWSKALRFSGIIIVVFFFFFCLYDERAQNYPIENGSDHDRETSEPVDWRLLLTFYRRVVHSRTGVIHEAMYRQVWYPLSVIATVVTAFPWPDYPPYRPAFFWIITTCARGFRADRCCSCIHAYTCVQTVETLYGMRMEKKYNIGK